VGLRNVAQAAVLKNVARPKNTTFVVFLVWLLCCIGRKTSLQEVQLEFPMVGHTRAEIDGFFSRVMVSLRGKTFCTFDEIREFRGRL